MHSSRFGVLQPSGAYRAVGTAAGAGKQPAAALSPAPSGSSLQSTGRGDTGLHRAAPVGCRGPRPGPAHAGAHPASTECTAQVGPEPAALPPGLPGATCRGGGTPTWPLAHRETADVTSEPEEAEPWPPGLSKAATRPAGTSSVLAESARGQCSLPTLRITGPRLPRPEHMAAGRHRPGPGHGPAASAATGLPRLPLRAARTGLGAAAALRGHWLPATVSPSAPWPSGSRGPYI